MRAILIKNIDNNMVEKYGERLKRKGKKNIKGKKKYKRTEKYKRKKDRKYKRGN